MKTCRGADVVSGLLTRLKDCHESQQDEWLRVSGRTDRENPETRED